MAVEEISAIAEYAEDGKAKSRLNSYIRRAYAEAVKRDDGSADTIAEILINSKLGYTQKEIQGWLE